MTTPAGAAAGLSGLSLQIVTFTETEADAIEHLLDDLVNNTSWKRSGAAGATFAGNLIHRIIHKPLRAQGNVVAAAALAELFADRTAKPDYVIFYGCAGVVDKKHLESAFLVGQVSYASLGTVKAGSSELVTLKNKWLCHVESPEVAPLPSIHFKDVVGAGTVNLSAITSMPAAHVVATDKVVKVAPANHAPAVKHTGVPDDVYAKDEWTYAQMLAFVRDLAASKPKPMPLLVEMESSTQNGSSCTWRAPEREIDSRSAAWNRRPSLWTTSRAEHAGR